MEIPTFDPLPEGSYLCTIVQADASPGCVNLRLRVVEPDDWLGQMIRSSITIPLFFVGPANNNVQRYFDLINACPAAFDKRRLRSVEPMIGETVVATIMRFPPDRWERVRVRHRNAWRGLEKLDVKTLKPPKPVLDDVPQDEVDGARFRLLEKRKGGSRG